uniref:BPTI/Kunitz inhibitor domain-containing protein n=1 Tax=Callorhinchus milii TaxID=7868 RepID=A0A4W3IYM2_CALMI
PKMCVCIHTHILGILSFLHEKHYIKCKDYYILLLVTDICQQPRDEGMCRNFVLRWYYDTKSAECTRFWYGGCNGNQNRFNTQDECAKNCTKGNPPGPIALQLCNK